jgi:formylglycine-generating enzyme required for sulfatase activity
MSTPGIFISHSHFDNVACRKIVHFLRDRLGLSADAIFFDESELHGGDDWFRRIQHEVIARPIFIVVLSRHSVVAEWVTEETNLALTKAVKDKSRKVIPVQIDPTLTMEAIEQFAPILTLRQIAHLEDGVAQANWDDLARVVQGQTSNQATHVNPAQAAELEQARDLVAQIQDEMAQRHYRIAVKLGREAVGLPGNERDATLWGDLGVALVQIGETDEGLAALETALKLNRTRPDLLRVKAQVLTKQGKYAEALQAWDKAFVATSAFTDRLAILAEAYNVLAAAQQWPLVNNVIADALDLAPTDATWQARRQLMPLHERFQRANDAKQWADALVVCDEALRIAPQDTTWKERRAQVQAALQEAQRAVAEQQRQAEQKLLPSVLRAKGFTLVQGKAIVPPLSAVIPAGQFVMGGDAQAYNGGNTGTPKVTVNLGAFQIGLYPVTVAEYACAVAAGAAKAPSDAFGLTWQQMCQQRPDHPVVNVSWLNARDYTAWLAGVTGQPWRLPSEPEWERAARGTDGRVFPWGNTWDATRANTSEGGPKTTTPVGAYADKGDASPVGAHDLAGNVWEWTKSLWATTYDAVKCESDSDSTTARVLRGGSWVYTSQLARAASRVRCTPDYFYDNRGFRLALAAGAGKG